MVTIEEKARAYDEKLDVARHIYADPSVKDEDKYYIEVIFPELAESEDERIRKEIIDLIEEVGEDDNYHVYCFDDMLSWLEKQGEMKEIIPEDATVDSNEDGLIAETIRYKNEKQGEQKPDECRQETKPNGGIVYEDFNEGDGYYKVNLEYLSKSQVELIEKLVSSWQNPTNNTAEWSEEDERMFDYAFAMIEWYGGKNEDKSRLVSDWLQSLKYRVQPQSQWKPSDEQLKHLSKAIIKLGTLCNEDVCETILILDELFEQLKKLREE